MKIRVFRWKAAAPLAVCAAFGALAWWLFADRLARRGLEAAGTAIVGGKVEIARVHLDLAGGKVAITGLTVASPHEALQNLLQADELVADLDVLPLLEKKVVINRLAANGLRFGTARTTDGRVPADTTSAFAGVTANVMREAHDWAGQVQVPGFQLAQGKVDVAQLDPARLETIRAADALAARADSSKQAWQAQIAAVNVGPTVDSAAATLQRLRGAKATDLAALNEARRMVDQIKRARDRVSAAERGVTSGVAALRQGAAGLDSAKRRDYAFARTLLKLPSLDAADIGAALFGRAAMAKFERALYWTEMGRRYMPPGLLPQADAGPKRARRAGVTVRFPKERTLPGFLLRDAELSFALGADSALKHYAGQLQGLTSSPALYGRPTTFTAAAPAVRIGALLDHVRGTPTDTAAAAIDGVALPEFALPSLPLHLVPGRGSVGLSFALRGDTVRARWGVRAQGVRWVRDSAAPAGSDLEQVVARALSGIQDLEVSAAIGGTLKSPRLSVHSNLDDAIAARLKAVVGEQVAAAERQVRSDVDRLVEAKAAPARAQVAAVTTDVTTRIADQKARLDRAQKDLEQRLRDLTRGIRLP